MRYIPHTEEEIGSMLEAIGAKGLDDLFSGIPKALRCKDKLDLPDGMAEQELWRHLGAMAMQNLTQSCSASFLGGGAYRHYVPAAVSELASRSEFVTPYTPYQPEVSQGTLQSMFEYQSQVCRLFSMDVANASHYSGATAAADAALMARRIGKRRRRILLPENMHPEYRHVVETVIANREEVTVVRSSGSRIDRASLDETLADDVAAVFVQFPNFFGIVEELGDVAERAHAAGALCIAVVPEPVALGILTPPGEWGADIAVGEGLSLGLPVSYGGPTLGIFTAKQDYLRSMPGRICGRTVDTEGRTGYVLTLSTREQHIRRERATSNICSNQALCATTAAIHMSLLGKEGMRELAVANAAKADYAKRTLAKTSGVALPFDSPTFNEFVIETERPASDILSALADQDIFGGIDLGRWHPNMERAILVCVTEMNTRDEIDRYAGTLGKIIE